MANSKIVGPVLLGAVTLAVISGTIYSLRPPAPVRTKKLDDLVRAKVKKLDAEKRGMSPTQWAKAEETKHDADLKAVAGTWTKNGVYLSTDQGVRLGKLGDVAIETGILPASDIDFLISTIRDPQSGSKEPGFIHFQAAYDLARVKTFTVTQKNALLKACLPLADSTSGLDRRCAVLGAKAVHSDAAISVALKMRQSTSETEQRTAKAYLADVGYRATE